MHRWNRPGFKAERHEHNLVAKRGPSTVSNSNLIMKDAVRSWQSKGKCCSSQASLNSPHSLQGSIIRQNRVQRANAN